MKGHALAYPRNKLVGSQSVEFEASHFTQESVDGRVRWEESVRRTDD